MATIKAPADSRCSSCVGSYVPGFILLDEAKGNLPFEGRNLCLKSEIVNVLFAGTQAGQE